MSTEFEGERIAKVIARAGICSRREAERLIEARKVSVNGSFISSAALNVTGEENIVVDGKPLPVAPRTRLWRYNKPAGLVTSHKDEKGRRTVFDAVRGTLGRVVSVGRLDMNSEGLLLLTNNGELARALELPSSGWVRRYRVRVYKEPMPPTIAQMKRGVEIEGVKYGAIDVKVEQGGAANVWLSVSLKEGKNREIRRVLEHFGHPVSRLIRMAYGPFQLGRLGRGEMEEVSGKVLRDQLGKAVSEKFFPKAHKGAAGRDPGDGAEG